MANEALFARQSTPLDAHRLGVAEVVGALATDPRRGLSQVEAARRLANVGRNELAAERTVPAWRRFAAQFKDILVVLLLVATAVSIAVWYYERDSALPYEAIAIFVERPAGAGGIVIPQGHGLGGDEST